MKRILLGILLLIMQFAGYSQTIESRWSAKWPASARQRAQSIDSVIKEIGTFTMGVPLRSTLDTIYTKQQGDYSLLIGSANDTIVIVDDLDYNIYNSDTTNTISTVKWQNSNNTSELYFRYADSVLPVNGTTDATKSNIATLVRYGHSGSFIDEVLQINYGYSMPKINVPTAPLYVASSAEIGAVGDSIFTLDFDQSVNITDTAGFSFTCTGDTVFAHTVSAGSGTSAINIALNRAVLSTDTITFSISGTNTITGVVGGLSFAGVTDETVVNNVIAEFTAMTIAVNNNVTVNGTTLVANNTVWNSSQVLYNEASVDNQITAFKVPNDAFDRSNVMLCLDVTNAIDAFANMDYAVYINGGSFGISYIYNSGSITPTVSTLIEGANTYIGFRRLSGNIEIVLSTDGGENWTQIHDFAVSDTRTLYVMTNQNGTSGGDIEIAEQK